MAIKSHRKKCANIRPSLDKSGTERPKRQKDSQYCTWRSGGINRRTRDSFWTARGLHGFLRETPHLRTGAAAMKRKTAAQRAPVRKKSVSKASAERSQIKDRKSVGSGKGGE